MCCGRPRDRMIQPVKEMEVDAAAANASKDKLRPVSVAPTIPIFPPYYYE